MKISINQNELFDLIRQHLTKIGIDNKAIKEIAIHKQRDSNYIYSYTGEVELKEVETKKQTKKPKTKTTESTTESSSSSNAASIARLPKSYMSSY